jgi:hypothetical protein
VNWRYDGLIPGSPSNVPSRTATRPGSSRLCAQSAPPHAVQKTFDQPSSGSNEPSRSSPAVIRSDPGARNADTAAALPVRRWQRVQ